VGRFADASEFGKQIAAFLKEIHGEGALAPGDPERLMAERRAREGIPLGSTVEELNKLADELGVAKL
jgi:LDH2 family malate/lactate/ureidoglycolate dehydrogenase